MTSVRIADGCGARTSSVAIGRLESPISAQAASPSPARRIRDAFLSDVPPFAFSHWGCT